MPKAGQFSICTEVDCGERMLARGYCGRHYAQRRSAGHLQPLPVVPVPDRFWAKVSKDGPIPDYRPDLGPCWIWTAGFSRKTGYGGFGYAGAKTRLAHRYSHELNIGPIPQDYEVDHLCRVRLCVRPSHLEAVTQQENLRRQFEAITHCPAGHPYAGRNLYIDPSGGRRCRKCSVQKTMDRYNGSVERVRFHGHSPVCTSQGDWRCLCGEPLGSAKFEARDAMRDRHVPQLRAQLMAVTT